MAERRGTELRWVEDPSALRRRAAALVVGFAGLRESSRVAEIVAQFEDEQVFRVVFESNHIEGAGAASLTETRKIAAEALGRRSTEPRATSERKLVVHRVWASRAVSWPETARRMALLPEGVPQERHLPVLTFDGRSRLGLEVLQHAIAVQRTLAHASQFNIKRMWLWASEQHTWSERDELPSFDWPEDWPSKEEISRPRLIDQAFVKRLHGGLAKDLLDPADTEGVDAGSYRRDRRAAGSLGKERWFLSPGQIEAAMRTWVRQSNRLACELGIDPLFRACWIMHRFTEIHPFPDFNGRMARLLMNLSLCADGLPFPVSFPAGSKWRRRYASALHAGDRQSFEPLMTLVARAIVDAFERLDTQLRTAGLRGIPEGHVGSYPPIVAPGQWGWGKRSEDGPIHGAPGIEIVPRKAR